MLMGDDTRVKDGLLPPVDSSPPKILVLTSGSCVENSFPGASPIAPVVLTASTGAVSGTGQFPAGCGSAASLLWTLPVGSTGDDCGVDTSLSRPSSCSSKTVVS